jgi:formate/nitrite transporter FocA (FNT family)
MSDSLAPAEIVETLIDIGAAKARYAIPDLLIRSSLSGALLAFGASLALLVSAEAHVPFVGALVFPVGFAIIILLGLELPTSNFGIVPLAVLSRRATLNQLLSN